jgi:hypothetical protein
VVERNQEQEEAMPPGYTGEAGGGDTTGALTGAAAGAVLGASAWPIGLSSGALISAALGGLAARAGEVSYYPEPWLTRRESATDRDE